MYNSCDLGINVGLLKKEKRNKEKREYKKGREEKGKKAKTMNIFLHKVEKLGFGIIILFNAIILHQTELFFISYIVRN